MTDTVTYYLYDDQAVYAGTVDLDAREPAPSLSTRDKPATPSRVGRYSRVDGAWTSYTPPSSTSYEPTPDPFAIAED